MKTTSHQSRIAIFAATAACLSLQSTTASTLTGPHAFAADPILGGISYTWTAQLGGTDSATFQRHVGAWSWEDNSLFGNPGQGTDPVGWTHTSDWAALLLTEATTLTVRLERQAGVSWPDALDPNRVASTASMFPSFTLYRGWDNNLAPATHQPAAGPHDDWHTYNNHGNVDWAEDLTYLDHVDNSTATFVERTWVLPAGEYSFALGSNSPATDPDRQGYRATLTAVPEPTAGVLLLGALSALAGRRTRTRRAA